MAEVTFSTVQLIWVRGTIVIDAPAGSKARPAVFLEHLTRRMAEAASAGRLERDLNKKVHWHIPTAKRRRDDLLKGRLLEKNHKKRGEKSLKGKVSELKQGSYPFCIGPIAYHPKLANYVYTIRVDLDGFEVVGAAPAIMIPAWTPDSHGRVRVKCKPIHLDVAYDVTFKVIVDGGVDQRTEVLVTTGTYDSASGRAAVACDPDRSVNRDRLKSGVPLKAVVAGGEARIGPIAGRGLQGKPLQFGIWDAQLCTAEPIFPSFPDRGSPELTDGIVSLKLRAEPGYFVVQVAGLKRPELIAGSPESVPVMELDIQGADPVRRLANRHPSEWDGLSAEHMPGIYVTDPIPGGCASSFTISLVGTARTVLFDNLCYQQVAGKIGETSVRRCLIDVTKGTLRVSLLEKIDSKDIVLKDATIAVKLSPEVAADQQAAADQRLWSNLSPGSYEVSTNRILGSVHGTSNECFFTYLPVREKSVTTIENRTTTASFTFLPCELVLISGSPPIRPGDMLRQSIALATPRSAEATWVKLGSSDASTASDPAKIFKIESASLISDDWSFARAFRYSQTKGDVRIIDSIDSINPVDQIAGQFVVGNIPDVTIDVEINDTNARSILGLPYLRKKVAVDPGRPSFGKCLMLNPFMTIERTGAEDYLSPVSSLSSFPIITPLYSGDESKNYRVLVFVDLRPYKSSDSTPLVDHEKLELPLPIPSAKEIPIDLIPIDLIQTYYSKVFKIDNSYNNKKYELKLTICLVRLINNVSMSNWVIPIHLAKLSVIAKISFQGGLPQSSIELQTFDDDFDQNGLTWDMVTS